MKKMFLDIETALEVNREVYKRMVFEGELEPKAAVQSALMDQSEDEPF